MYDKITLPFKTRRNCIFPGLSHEALVVTPPVPILILKFAKYLKFRHPKKEQAAGVSFNRQMRMA
jgi:hypothetical protein